MVPGYLASKSDRWGGLVEALDAVLRVRVLVETGQWGPGGGSYIHSPGKSSARKSRGGDRTALCSNVQLTNVGRPRPETRQTESKCLEGKPASFPAFSLLGEGKREEERASERVSPHMGAQVFG